MSIEKLLLALLFALVVVLLKFITGLNSNLAQAYTTILPAFFSSVFIVILVRGILADKPKLKLKMECKTEISGLRYVPRISVLTLYNLVVLYPDIHTPLSKYIYTVDRRSLISPIRSDLCLQD